jgi:hypothetical protein
MKQGTRVRENGILNNLQHELKVSSTWRLKNEDFTEFVCDLDARELR